MKFEGVNFWRLVDLVVDGEVHLILQPNENGRLGWFVFIYFFFFFIIRFLVNQPSFDRHPTVI